MIIVWTRQGHIPITAPLIALLATQKIFPHSHRAEAIVSITLGIGIFWLGRRLNSNKDVAEKGPHLLFKIPMELWGLVLSAFGVMQLMGLFK